MYCNQCMVDGEPDPLTDTCTQHTQMAFVKGNTIIVCNMQWRPGGEGGGGGGGGGNAPCGSQKRVCQIGKGAKMATVIIYYHSND